MSKIIHTIKCTLLTQLTFSFSVAFMKMFIQYETLSFTPTTTEENTKQCWWTAIESFHFYCITRSNLSGISKTDPLVWAWLRQLWGLLLCSPECPTQKQAPCPLLQLRKDTQGKLNKKQFNWNHVKKYMAENISECESHLSGNNCCLLCENLYIFSCF